MDYSAGIELSRTIVPGAYASPSEALPWVERAIMQGLHA